MLGALGLEEVHAIRGGGDGEAADVVQAAGLAGDGFQLLVELDRVALERRHVGVGVQRVEAARRVPRGSGGELRALDQHDVLPAELGQMVEHAAADDAAADDGYLHMGFHCSGPLLCPDPPILRDGQIAGQVPESRSFSMISASSGGGSQSL